MTHLLTSTDDLFREIQESKVKDVKRIKTSKTLGLDNILIKVWRCLGGVAIVWLTKLFIIIFWFNKMSDE
jgi:hypothetical protein